MALPTAAAVIRESLEKKLIDNAQDLNCLILRLTRVLLEASQPVQSIAYRRAASESLKSTGKFWLELDDKEPETSRNLFMTFFHLIQDEDKEVRGNVATFMTSLMLSSTGQDDFELDLLSCAQCVKEFALHIHRWFQPFHLLPIVVDWLSRGLDAGAEELEPLYDSGEANFYSEEDESVAFIGAVTQSCLSKIPASSYATVITVDRLLAEADLLIARVEMDEKEQRMFSRSEAIESALRRLSARLRISRSCFKEDPCIEQLNLLQIRIANLGIS